MKAILRWIRGSAVSREALVLKQLPKRSIGAEIGVWKGDFAAEMLSIVEPAKLHLIDPWIYRHGDEYAEALYGRREAASQQFMDQLYDGVRQRFAIDIGAGKVVVHRMLSVEAAGCFPDRYFDWVYIDGDHTYDFVKADLDSYLPKLKPGGLISGDDYVAHHWWKDGVMRAVDEMIEAGTCKKVLLKAGQFVLQRQ